MIRRAFLSVVTVALAASSVLAVPGIGDAAPEISVGSWVNLPGGMKSLSLKELKGQVILLDFWATW